MLANMGICLPRRCLGVGLQAHWGVGNSEIAQRRLESAMPIRRSKYERIHEKILDSASRLFNRHGFNAVSIDDVMGDAGLTRGSFYTYFSSKTDLYAQSVARVVCTKRDAGNG